MKLRFLKCKYNVNDIYKLNRSISTGTQTNTCAQIDVCEIIRKINLLYRAHNKPAQQKKTESLGRDVSYWEEEGEQMFANPLDTCNPVEGGSLPAEGCLQRR